MAGDWIKIEHVTPDKPEVHRMADLLNIDPDAVLGKLARIWIWADQQTLNGNAPSVTLSLLDRITCVANFGEALEMVGWIIGKNGQLDFTNFGYHNGTTAKARALSNKRVKRHRNGDSVTKPFPEKRREEKINNPPNPPNRGEPQIESYSRRSKRPPKVDPIEELEAKYWASPKGQAEKAAKEAAANKETAK